MNARRIAFAISIFATGFISVARATSITVNNPSFETLGAGGLPFACGAGCSFSTDGVIPGWTVTGGGGLFQPGTAGFFDFVPDGITVAYTNGGSISQTVAPTAQAGVTYTLTVFLGVRHDLGDPGTIDLQIGGNAPVLATGVLPSPGGWSAYTATYTALAADAGKSISIVLASTGPQGDFDNVSLSSSGGAVPEPATSALVGLSLAGLATIVRRKRA